MRTAVAIVACAAFEVTGGLDMFKGQFKLGLAEVLVGGANIIFLLLLP